jgi:hypothetical protein
MKKKSSHGADIKSLLNRREMLRRAGGGMGLLAMAGLLRDQGLLASTNVSLNPLAPKPPHFAAQAKSVIWLFMNGGPSQVDTWDYKPELARRDGMELDGFDNKTGFFSNAVGPLMKSPFAWAQHGQSGSWVSDLFPHMSAHVDKMAATYGLGNENQNMPSFVVMSDPLDRGLPKGHALNWGAGFLPSVYQGTWLRPKGDPMPNLQSPAHMSPDQQRAQLDLLAGLNQPFLNDSAIDQELAARIESFELAYRMQTAAPDAFNVSSESEHIQQLYGLDQKHCSHMAAQCLTARRMVERGVRFVQIYSGGMENQRSWDGHNDIVGNHRGFARETDQPIAGLLADLEQRGLLDSTLVVWGGEFGRLPVAQKAQKPGRDHNPHAFTFWLAGGGVKGGVHYGETDEIGHRAMVDRVSVNDLHATMLRLLGFDHEQLTYFHNGRNFRLTDVGGNVVREVLA